MANAMENEMWTVGSSWDREKRANGIVVREHRSGVGQHKLFEIDWPIDASLTEIASAIERIAAEMKKWDAENEDVCG